MLLVSLSGYAQSGKDTVAGFLTQDHGFRRYAFADRLRDALLALDPCVEADGGYPRLSRLIDFYGWDIAKVNYPEVRRLMQVFGTEVGRHLFGGNVWVDLLFKQLEEEKPERVVITDCRFDNEIKAVLDCGGYPAWVARPGVEPVNAHVSDNALSAASCALVIPNTGTLTELRDSVQSLADELGF